MDARVVVVTADDGLAEVVMPQVSNLGATVVRAEDTGSARGRLEWADGFVVDLVLDGGSELASELLDVVGPGVLVVAPSGDSAGWAADRGAVVLAEPFSIVDVVEGLRALVSGRQVVVGDGNVIDLRSRFEADDRPWWATR